MEKLWWRLAREFVARGHELTIVNRRWPGWEDDEVREGVRLIRVPGHHHRRSLPQNLVLDFLWGRRVTKVLPQADILITNTIALPMWVTRRRPGAGRLVVNLNRYPKGQLRWYRGVTRVQAASAAIAEAASQQCPRLNDRIRVSPNPIDYGLFADAAARRSRPPAPVVIGFHGRIHREKGLQLLVAAAVKLLARKDLPLWRLELRGPVDIARGGSGDAFLNELLQQGQPLRVADRLLIHSPEFDPHRLAHACADIDIFCYPSVGERGEALGVAVLEAMAARRPVVVTGLDCFRDFVRDGSTGLILDHWTLPDAPVRLADLLARLMTNLPLREQLGTAAQAAVCGLDYARVADAMLTDFAQLLHERT